MTSIENQIINLIISQDENDQVDFKKNIIPKRRSTTLLRILFLLLIILNQRISISFLALKTLLGMS